MELLYNALSVYSGLQNSCHACSSGGRRPLSGSTHCGCVVYTIGHVQSSPVSSDLRTILHVPWARAHATLIFEFVQAAPHRTYRTVHAVRDYRIARVWCMVQNSGKFELLRA